MRCTYCPGSSDELFFYGFVSQGCCTCAALWVCDSFSEYLCKHELSSLGQKGTLLVRSEGSTLKEPLPKCAKHSAYSPAKLSLSHWRCSASGSHTVPVRSLWLSNPFCHFPNLSVILFACGTGVFSTRNGTSTQSFYVQNPELRFCFLRTKC